MQSLGAQVSVPVRELAAPATKSAQGFSNIFSIHQIANGRVLVNDGIRRQLILLDSALANPIVVLDSAGSLRNNGYGPSPTPLIAYLGDSSLFVEASSSSLLVIDPMGRVIRTIAAPTKDGFRYLGSSPSWVDATGNLLYRMGADDPPKRVMNSAGNEMTLISQFADSAPIVRVRFDVRTVDTVGRIKQRSASVVRLK